MTSVDALVASGATLTVDGSGLSGTKKLTWDGSAETNGSFNITGGAGADTIIGGSGADTITGGAGADAISSGNNNDVLQYSSGSELAIDTQVDGGSGTDTVLFTIAGVTDVDDSDFVKVINVEAIVFGNGNNVATFGTNAASAVGSLSITG